eukprot:NODE_219_length_2199_cov_177.880000_g142_i6.p1 GENE.NODE_219_length_2199_cov_177.880000_g142_i6~~NODE_219_length_2199_cov_177.880000_g142_i6.p1  ORF type:complete len:699 (-),score=173.73 NODE_219_length_2199_cov_177.880000_g142_i6:103-2148(-)
MFSCLRAQRKEEEFEGSNFSEFDSESAPASDSGSDVLSDSSSDDASDASDSASDVSDVSSEADFHDELDEELSGSNLYACKGLIEKAVNTRSSSNFPAHRARDSGNACNEPDLNSKSGWCARVNRRGQWHQMDLGCTKGVAGVAIQGRRGYGQRVTKFKISTSTDGRKFTFADKGKVFTGNHDNKTIVKAVLENPVEARYVRIVAISWHGHISMRSAILVCKDGQYNCAEHCKWGTATVVNRSWSSAFGLHHAADSRRACTEPEINSKSGWCARVNRRGQWHEMDLGVVKAVGGVSIQGRRGYGQRITSFRVKYSEDGKKYRWVDSGKIFEGNHDNVIVKKVLFNKEVDARFVRVVVHTWHGHISARLGVLECVGKGDKDTCPKKYVVAPYTRSSSTNFGAHRAADSTRACVEPDINSKSAWCAKVNRRGQWHEMDMGEEKEITGVAIQGRRGYGQRVTKFKVKISNDGRRYKWVDGGKVYSGNDDNDTVKKVLFNEPVGARYVRIVVISWRGHISMRCAVLTCNKSDDKCACNDSVVKPYKRKSSSNFGAHRAADSTRACTEPDLNSKSGWCARHNRANQWHEMDAGGIEAISGIAIQGRRGYGQRVTGFTVKYSKDGRTWKWVDHGKVFEGNNDNTTVKKVIFNEAIYGRYVRIVVKSWHSHISMRCALLLCDKAKGCK